VPVLMAGPPGVVTMILRVLAPDGTVAEISVYESTVKVGALTPSKVRAFPRDLRGELSISQVGKFPKFATHLRCHFPDRSRPAPHAKPKSSTRSFNSPCLGYCTKSSFDCFTHSRCAIAQRHIPQRDLPHRSQPGSSALLHERVEICASPGGWGCRGRGPKQARAEYASLQ
jgi:hypothetical protein